MEHYTDEQVARGRRTLHRAEAWRRENADAWLYMVGLAKQLAEREQAISGRGLIEAARRKAFTAKDGTDTKTNNDYAAIVARWIAAEHPETAPYIERRKTVFDLLVA